MRPYLTNNRGLAGWLFLAIAFLILALITGAAIGTLAKKPLTIAIIVLLLLGIVASAVYFRKR